MHRPGAPLSSGWLQRLLGTKSLAAGHCAHRAALGGHSHVGKNTQNYEVQRCVHLRRSLRRELLGPCDLSAPLHPSLLRALLQAPAVAGVRCCRNTLLCSWGAAWSWGAGMGQMHAPTGAGPALLGAEQPQAGVPFSRKPRGSAISTNLAAVIIC